MTTRKRPASLVPLLLSVCLAAIVFPAAEVVAQIRGEPDIDVTIDRSDFGEVPVGDFALRSLTIRNHGDAALSVSVVSLVERASPFAIVGFPVGGASLPPTAAISFDVRFAPAASGREVGTIRTRSDDPDEPIVDLVVTGTGVEVRRPRIDSVNPTMVDARGGDEVLVRGAELSSDMRLFVAGDGEVDVEFTFRSSREVIATMPPHAPGLVALGVQLGAGAADIARDAIEYVDPTAPAPQEIEATLVDSIVQLDWVNPEPFAEILVYRGGELVERLPGDALGFTDPEPVSGDRADYALVGRTVAGTTGLSRFVAARPLCVPVATYAGSIIGKRGGRGRGLRGALRGAPRLRDCASRPAACARGRGRRGC